MATETPVVAHNVTAIPEHIWPDPDWSRVSNGSWGKGKPKGNKRGLVIPVEYSIIDPWGNSIRSFPDQKAAVKLLVQLSKMKPNKLEAMVADSRRYAISRNWEATGDVLVASLRKALGERGAAMAKSASVALPASAPRPIPTMYGIPDTGGIE
jgi:hypothetical protein